MKKLLISFLAAGALIFFAGAPVFAVTNLPPSSAPPPPPFQVDISSLPNVAAGPSKIQAVLTIVFSVIGAVCLLMITIGGFRYITSEGDPQALSKAKGTIIYALVGLIVSILAVSIVTFVLGKV